ncbi:hypothetical protein QL285_019050 [Trifolium repens]|nr:hypothetical protein QL285_019050 [Trifolium repens]
MASDLDEHGASFLKHGETSQSLTISDIFTLKDGSVKPVLKPANPPVRANVLYLSSEFSYDAAILHTTFARLLGPPRELKTSHELQFFHELVNRLNNQIRGFKVCGYLFVLYIAESQV